MSTPSSAGIRTKRTREKRDQSRGLEVIGITQVAVDNSLNLDARHVRSALTTARETDYDAFRETTNQWADANFPILGMITRNLFGETAGKYGADTGYAVQLGALLGVNIVRLCIDSGDITSEECGSNISSWPDLAARLISYKGEEISQPVLESIFIDETATAITEIRNPAARVGCMMILGVSLQPALVLSGVASPSAE